MQHKRTPWSMEKKRETMNRLEAEAQVRERLFGDARGSKKSGNRPQAKKKLAWKTKESILQRIAQAGRAAKMLYKIRLQKEEESRQPEERAPAVEGKKPRMQPDKIKFFGDEASKLVQKRLVKALMDRGISLEEAAEAVKNAPGVIYYDVEKPDEFGLFVSRLAKVVEIRKKYPRKMR